MGRKFVVRIRMEALRANLASADGKEYDDTEIRQWLLDAGFEPVSGTDVWRVDESDLGHLDPSEVSGMDLASE